jgi:cell division protein FtsQ
MRGYVFDAAAGATEAVFSGMASAGFGISAIDITGQSLTSETKILSALAIAPRTSLLSFDADAARKRLLELPAVSDADIRKAYPNRLVVSVSEKTPVARWTVDGATYLVDAAGTRLVTVPSTEDADLPLIVGQGAADNAAAIIRALGLYPALNSNVIALSRIGDRRWDVLYDTGLRVQLPESGITQALGKLDALERGHAILERDLSLIDMRVAQSIIVRVNAERAETSANETSVN